jgi:hypothetical protein
MDCGGKRSATPLWLSIDPDRASTTTRTGRTAPPEAKAPSPLRSAGALSKGFAWPFCKNFRFGEAVLGFGSAFLARP